MAKCKRPSIPGVPCITDEKTGQREIIAPGRVIRGRSGQPLLCKNPVEGRMVADAAGKLIGQTVALVRFEGKGGARIEQVGFAAEGGSLPHGGTAAIEAMVFLAGEQLAKAKSKWKALTPAAGR